MNISKEEAIKHFEDFDLLVKTNKKIPKESNEIISCILWKIENTIEQRNEVLMSEIKTLKRLENRTLYIGDIEKFPKGCYSCLCGNGLNTIRKTNKCNLECKFCYYFGKLDEQNAVPNDLWKIGGNMYHEKDIDLLIDTSKKPSGVAYAYLEPFIEIEKYYSIIKKFRKKYPPTPVYEWNFSL